MPTFTVRKITSEKLTSESFRKLWSSGRVLGLRSEGRGFNPRPLLEGNGVKAMPG